MKNETFKTYAIINLLRKIDEAKPILLSMGYSINESDSICERARMVAYSCGSKFDPYDYPQVQRVAKEVYDVCKSLSRTGCDIYPDNFLDIITVSRLRKYAKIYVRDMILNRR